MRYAYDGAQDTSNDSFRRLPHVLSILTREPLQTHTYTKGYDKHYSVPAHIYPLPSQAALYGRDSDGEDAPSGRSPPLGASPTGRGVVSPSRAALPWAHTPSLRAQCRDDDEDLLGLSL